jgi:hypothetical protein
VIKKNLGKGQANDALEGLRESLGHKSILFRENVSEIINEIISLTCEL